MSDPLKLTEQEIELVIEFRQLTDLGRANLVNFLKVSREKTEQIRREIEDEGPNPYDE